ncbi:alpha/beta-hydrolase [Dentipellis sp. KUC8613]|nr:alpha/beta-hydrolase [Dentipellis sp. KUC8613]
MPYVDLVADDDYVSIWYITNTATHDVSGFDPEKPTIIMLHPMLFDTTWLHNHLDDPRINSNYNIVAFDARYAGKTLNRPNGKLDHWVEAADLALACQTLWLPPAHVWAEESLATNVAMRFAALFPEMCLSLTLVTVAPPTELKTLFATFDEMINLWGFAEDLDSYEHAISELLNITVGFVRHSSPIIPEYWPYKSAQEQDSAFIDEVVAFWQTTYPPFRRSRFMELGNLLMNRVALKQEVLSSIRQPVLLIHGERNEMHPVKYAQQLIPSLPNVQGGATLYVVKGAHGFISLTPSSFSIMNQAFAKFLSRLPRSRSDLVPPSIPMRDRMNRALRQLAEFVESSAIADRNPLSSMSFSTISPVIEKHQTTVLKLYYKDQMSAFSPLASSGRPARKFSERRDGHWFYSEPDGLSYAGPFLASGYTSSSADRPSSANPPRSSRNEATYSEPVSTDIVNDSRMRRATLNVRSVDKHVVKGSMSKMVAGTAPGMPTVGKLLGFD